MSAKGQSSLDYVMTYGMALILIAVVVAVLIFILSSPASSVVFSSSDSAKILLKAGAVSGTDADIRMQNITGGSIEVTSASMAGGYSTASCNLNGQAFPSGSPGTEVNAGGSLFIECDSVSDSGKGRISINYVDYAGLARTVDVTGSEAGATGLFGAG
jgi:hypothetical protein